VDGERERPRRRRGREAATASVALERPEKALPPARKFEKPALPNLTGTMADFRPDGSLARSGVRPASTGDYQAWKPD
jgi:NADH:ubiquinone oxidoreductase subunit